MYFSGNGEIDTDMDTNILDTNTDINTDINTDAYSEELEKLKNDPRIELMKSGAFKGFPKKVQERSISRKSSSGNA